MTILRAKQYSTRMSEREKPKKSKVVFRKVERPKHAEELSTRESDKFRPWRVTLKVEPSMEDREPIDYDIYLRCETPEQAQWTAYAAFTAWEKTRVGLTDIDWPRVSEEVPSEAFPLDEDTWSDVWKYAKAHFPCRWTGMDENPSIFRFTTNEWVAELKKRKQRSILVPENKLILPSDAGSLNSEAKKKKAIIDAKLKKK